MLRGDQAESKKSFAYRSAATRRSTTFVRDYDKAIADYDAATSLHQNHGGLTRDAPCVEQEGQSEQVSPDDAEEAKNQNLDCERRQGGFDGRLFDECSVSVRSTDAVCVLPVSRTVLARRPERCNAIRRIRRYFGRKVTKVFAVPTESGN